MHQSASKKTLVVSFSAGALFVMLNVAAYRFNDFQSDKWIKKGGKITTRKDNFHGRI